VAFSQAQLDALDEALATGALSVKYADRSVTYRSLSDMIALRDRMARTLESPKRPIVSTAVFYSGGD